LWGALRKRQTGLRFRHQHPAGCYILDFYCDSVKLCVEVDDLSHDFTAARDAGRDRWLARQGVHTLRVSARDVLRNLDGVVQYILEQARSPSAALRAPPPPEGGSDRSHPQLYPRNIHQGILFTCVRDSLVIP
jgi:very-short-patch-repair endonuclease